mgnify:CR=1 FL=1
MVAYRLISPPNGLGLVGIEPLGGPRTIGASSNTSIGNFTQTVATPFAAWRFRFSFHVMRGASFRAYRGWVTAMHGGANATRWQFFDPDMRSPRECGLDVPAHVRWPDTLLEQNWGNDEPWANGAPWAITPPLVPIASPSSRDDTLITLADSFWGHDLQRGEYLGFQPFHFGLYIITEVIEPGTYRIWPQLRKGLDLGDYATLFPTLAMRMESEEAATAGRELVVADDLHVTMVEVFDYDVRDYFVG